MPLSTSMLTKYTPNKKNLYVKTFFKLFFLIVSFNWLFASSTGDDYGWGEERREEGEKKKDKQRAVPLVVVLYLFVFRRCAEGEELGRLGRGTTGHRRKKKDFCPKSPAPFPLSYFPVLSTPFFPPPASFFFSPILQTHVSFFTPAFFFLFV
eukprot:TRINITY_DN10_c0_g1_i1.p1 TRINITY_DN10_c0_g1~~TRINITY_DN10_c0_g1_i1.p1  ORF type:complete len:152 (+),score=9.60 TRINITY_DN10_c0_g1_i1:264-719(+)